MIDLRLNIRDDRQFKSLTGLSEEQFEKLCPIFCEVYEEALEEAHVQAIFQERRKNERGGGRKGKLPTIEDKLFFVLYYFKVYPTFDVLASIFDMSRSKACENIHKLTPVLHEALFRAGLMPYRSFESVEEFKKAFDGIDRLIIDVTERKHVRPQDDEKQAEMYSGKKKGHTVKNTIISTTDKVIMFVGQTFTGHNHDYKMLKEEFPPDKPWFSDINVLLDLGYQGIQKDYKGEGIEIPVKKPRKSKANPEPKLSEDAKEKNRALSKIRIFIENAIGGIKRYNILNHPFRNRKKPLMNDAIAICAGLWNMILPAPG
jgi:hypothetical protein